MDAGTSFPVIGEVYSRAGDKPLEGARVCIANREEIPCAVADSSGRYALELPAWREPTEIAVHVSAPGHLGFTGIGDFEIYDGAGGA